MSNNLTAALPYAQIATASTSAVSVQLAELRAVHGRVEATFDVMDQLVREPVADRQRYSMARFRTSQASLARRNMSNRIVRELLPTASAEVAAQLAQLQRQDMELLNVIAAHISRWGVEATDADWAGYCRASRDVGRKLRAQVEAEKRLLYRLLA